MEHKPHYISICSQKGGVGKSTFTVLVASLLHYRLGRRVLVADCDYPQWSIREQRQRELNLLDQSKYYKLMMIRQFTTSGRKIWPVIECRAQTAFEQVSRYLEKMQEPIDYVLFDLPGTVASKGVLHLIGSLDRVFVPMKADKIVMESTITFARMLAETFMAHDTAPLSGVHLFWSMLDGRERTLLYEQYEQALASFGLSVMRTHIPQRTRFSRELQVDGGPVYRSTLYPADRAFAAECSLEALCAEICSLTENK